MSFNQWSSCYMAIVAFYFPLNLILYCRIDVQSTVLTFLSHFYRIIGETATEIR